MKKYRKLYRIRKKKKSSILKNRFFWLFLLIFILFGGIFYFASFSRFFQVEGSEISGNEKVSSESLENILNKEIGKKILFFYSKSIFFANPDKIRERILEEFPQIAKVNLKRNFPNKISIQIEERLPAAIFCQRQQPENCFLIDKEGFIIDSVSGSENLKSANPVRNLISNGAKIIGEIKSSDLGIKVIEKNYLDSILEIQRKLKEKQKIESKEFIPSEKKLTVSTFEGWQIFFDPAENISDQIFNLDALLKEKIPPENRGNLEYIDLRFGSKVYFKNR